MTTKKFRIDKHEIKKLIGSIGGCMATDKITADGELVGYMYREAPNYKNDSGWVFLSGTEDQAYADNADNWQIYDGIRLRIMIPRSWTIWSFPLGQH